MFYTVLRATDVDSSHTKISFRSTKHMWLLYLFGEMVIEECGRLRGGYSLTGPIPLGILGLKFN